MFLRAGTSRVFPPTRASKAFAKVPPAARLLTPPSVSFLASGCLGPNTGVATGATARGLGRAIGIAPPSVPFWVLPGRFENDSSGPLVLALSFAWGPKGPPDAAVLEYLAPPVPPSPS